MAFKMKPKSPLAKKLVGKQNRLPDHLKQKILDAPETPMKKTKEQRIEKRKDRISKKFRGNIKSVQTRLDDGDLRGARITRRMLVAMAKGKKGKAKSLRRKQEAQDSRFWKEQSKSSGEK